MKEKRDYLKWAVSEIISGLSRTPETEIINIKRMGNGEFLININGECEVLIRKPARIDKKERVA